MTAWSLHWARACTAFLLHGVTGSGKTSVFIRLIDTVVQRGKQVILLVPEIALTPQIVEQFYQLFGSIVAVIHSELSLGQRSETWRSIASGAVKIIIGTRSADFCTGAESGADRCGRGGRAYL